MHLYLVGENVLSLPLIFINKNDLSRKSYRYSESFITKDSQFHMQQPNKHAKKFLADVYFVFVGNYTS